MASAVGRLVGGAARPRRRHCCCRPLLLLPKEGAAWASVGRPPSRRRPLSSVARASPRQQEEETEGEEWVCGMVILHRHGERAPMVNFWHTLGSGVQAQEPPALEEERRWLGRLPTPERLAELETLFPVQSAAAKTPRDRRSKPFGCLTGRGLEGMRGLGEGIRELHPGVLGPQAAASPASGTREPSSSNVVASGPTPVEFEVFSSNFSRTQQSAQGLLHGLAAHELAAGAPVPVVVRQEKDCTIHMYDNDPSTIQEEVARVLRAPAFVARQDEHETLKAELVRLIPGLTADNFKWMEAADFFWCRPPDSDLELPQQLEALRQPTVEYVAWRFQQYYAHRPLLGLVIAPLVREILATLGRMANEHASAAGGDCYNNSSNNGQPRRCRVSIFSGHDVTVLAFLHALDWPLVRDPSWWPPYGCALVFELLAPKPGGSLARLGGDHRVRIRLEMSGQRVPISLPVLGSGAGPGRTDLTLRDLALWMKQQGFATVDAVTAA